MHKKHVRTDFTPHTFFVEPTKCLATEGSFSGVRQTGTVEAKGVVQTGTVSGVRQTGTIAGGRQTGTILYLFDLS